mmetsp:Transcript_4835/g.6259  ORF Transcript_4835/g.6259 Transcript_4835/m.6259 type:complete len:186 (+) Transcript_4835:89-646(+)
MTYSTIYERHYMRRARTQQNLNDTRPALMRVIAGLPIINVFIPPCRDGVEIQAPHHHMESQINNRHTKDSANQLSQHENGVPVYSNVVETPNKNLGNASDLALLSSITAVTATLVLLNYSQHMQNTAKRISRLPMTRQIIPFALLSATRGVASPSPLAIMSRNVLRMRVAAPAFCLIAMVKNLGV